MLIHHLLLQWRWCERRFQWRAAAMTPHRGLSPSACMKLSSILCGIAPGRGVGPGHPWPPDIRLPARAALQCLICWVLLSGLTEVKEPRPLLSPSLTLSSLPSSLLTPRELVCLLLASVCCGTDLDQMYERNLGLHGYLFDLLDLLTDGPCYLRPTSCRGHFRVVSGPLSEH